MTICYILWPFGIVCGHLLFSSLFGMFGPHKKNLATPALDFGGKKGAENRGGGHLI
jgi:hypothetical protein